MESDYLDQLISIGENLTASITYVPPGEGVIRRFSVYATSKKEPYQNWLSMTQRFIKMNHPSDLQDYIAATDKISIDNHHKILGILRAIKLWPDEPIINTPKDGALSNNINIINTLTNTQQQTLHVFQEAIKDELTGKDIKALREILKKYEAEPEVTKGTLVDKLKGFGGDVLSNIVANVLTNPAIYNGFFN